MLLGLDLTFSTDMETFGKMEVVDIVPNGRNVEVTDVNKEDYVKALAEFRLTRAIHQQIEAFLQVPEAVTMTLTITGIL